MRLLGVRPEKVVVFIVRFEHFLSFALDHKTPRLGFLLRYRRGSYRRPHGVQLGRTIE